MEPFTTLTAPALHLAGRNIDTDQIVPARFLRNPRKQGYANYLFHDLRFRPDGTPDPSFALNVPRNVGARILVVDENFGCGSSREGAVFALFDSGYRCVIAPSLGDIFRNNCFKNGVLPILLEPQRIDELLRDAPADAPAVMTVDLHQQTLSQGSVCVAFEIEPFWKECLLSGADDIDMTLRYREAIENFARVRFSEHPWLETHIQGTLA